MPALERAGFDCTVRPFASRALHRAIQRDELAAKVVYTPLCYLRRVAELTTISQYDAVIVHRGIFPFPWPGAEGRVIRSKGKVIFDFDDAIHIGHRNTERLGPWIYGLKYGAGVNEMMRSSSLVIAGNQILADHAHQFNSNVAIVPTVVDLEHYSYRSTENSDHRVLTIGWMGSRSTSPYLLEIESVLRELSDAHPGKIQLLVWSSTT